MESSASIKIRKEASNIIIKLLPDKSCDKYLQIYDKNYTLEI